MSVMSDDEFIEQVYIDENRYRKSADRELLKRNRGPQERWGSMIEKHSIKDCLIRDCNNHDPAEHEHCWHKLGWDKSEHGRYCYSLGAILEPLKQNIRCCICMDESKQI